LGTAGIKNPFAANDKREEEDKQVGDCGGGEEAKMKTKN
jgi:hypothetical protein